LINVNPLSRRHSIAMLWLQYAASVGLPIWNHIYRKVVSI
jgi:hypothetical protein